MFPLSEFLQQTEDGKRARNVTNYVQTEAGLWVPMKGTSDGKILVEVHKSSGENIVYGAGDNDKPSASSVPIGTFYQAVNTDNIWQSNGSSWVPKTTE
jgi:hypothetical protein